MTNKAFRMDDFLFYIFWFVFKRIRFCNNAFFFYQKCHFRSKEHIILSEFYKNSFQFLGITQYMNVINFHKWKDESVTPLSQQSHCDCEPHRMTFRSQLTIYRLGYFWDAREKCQWSKDIRCNCNPTVLK